MTRSLLRILNVTVLDGYRLALTFSDDTSGIADLKDHLVDVLEPLKDPKLFAMAHVHGGALVWNDDIDVDVQFLYALAHHLPPPLTLEDVDRNRLEVSLREVRRLAGKTQTDVAKASGLAQSEVSRIEGRDDSLTSTLRRYVEGLGGQLDLVARVNGREVVIRGASEIADRGERRTPHLVIELGLVRGDASRDLLRGAFHTALAQLTASRSARAVRVLALQRHDALAFDVDESDGEALRRRILDVARELGVPIGEVKIWAGAPAAEASAG